jgi:hypothetical protein
MLEENAGRSSWKRFEFLMTAHIGALEHHVENDKAVIVANQARFLEVLHVVPRTGLGTSSEMTLRSTAGAVEVDQCNEKHTDKSEGSRLR